MSGAESLAIFGIACNVMQWSVVRKMRPIWSKLSINLDLDPDPAHRRPIAWKEAWRDWKILGEEKALNQDEEELLDIANGSLEDREELKAELDKIAGTSAKGKRSHSLCADGSEPPWVEEEDRETGESDE